MKTQTSCSTLSDRVLVASLVAAAGDHRRSEARVIRFIAEMDRRKLYREHACSSMFAYCVQRLAMAEGAAYRRTGGGGPSEIQAHGAGVDESIAPLSLKRPPGGVVQHRPASLGALSKGRYELRLTVGEDAKRHLERALELSAIGVDMDELVEDAIALLADTLEQRRLGALGASNRSKRNGNGKRPANPRGRYLGKAIRRQVFERDGGQCTFTDGQGHRCVERTGLHFDHVVPHSRGGESSAANLRLLCGPHNQLHAERCLGPLFVAERRAAHGPRKQA